MKSSTRLDSIVFQLTPTRTRCDLVITANGKSEKIASGLLNPFLAHLRAAQEQIGKGGYSIVLEPKRGSDSTWFTKGTVERFVRFVSTPEILERVYTIESEIVQIEKAISIQNNGDTVAHFQVEDLPAKAEENIEGSKVATNGNEKAIVLYQPSTHQPEEDRSTMQEKNSKVQLVQVLETRKTVLQKEQGMAFARAVAADFAIDNIAALHSFAESFGASRMMDAGNRFVDLWKAKHESGQWVDVEATEAMSCRSDLPSTNASGIMLLGSNEKGLWPQGEAISEKNGIPFATGADGRPQAYNQEQPSPKEQIPGQFPHPMFPSWQMHSQGSGFPVFQPYPMPGMPYYQNYPGNGPFFQPPYPPLDDSILHSGQRTRQRRHSMDSRDLSAEIETQEIDASGSRRQDDVDTDEEDSVRQGSRKRGGKSSRKQSGTVVIRNVNYIASAKQGFSDSDPESCSDSGTDDEDRKVKADEMRKLKKKGKSAEAGDDGHWQAFQNFLLKDADDSNNSARSDMFAMEGKVQGRKRQALIADASSMLGRRPMGGNQDADFSEHHDVEGDMACLRKPIAEQMLDCGKEAQSADGRTDRQFIDVEGQRCAYRRSADANIDSMINRQEKLTDVWDSSLDPVITNGFRVSSNNNNRGPALDMADESLVILHKSRSLDQVGGVGRTSMDMDYEVPSALQGVENHTVRHRSRSNCEPDDLNLMPDRVEHGSSGYDPALDYEIQAQVNNASKMGGKKKEVKTDAKGPKKVVKEQKLKAEKRIIAGTRREKPSKLSPSEDARARAERLRAFKADLQKLKKEKEEEQVKRLEALRLQRQKRIAARSGANPPQSPLPSHQARKQLPKLSPISQKGSKFSDTEPGSSSPLQRSTLKTISKVSSDSSKASPRLNDGSHASGNRLTRSASSLSVRKEENNVITPESKATIARIRRLSEPKGTVHQMSSGKIQSVQAVSRRRVSVGPETKRMSTTANLDKTKSSTPLELKLKASKISPGSTQKKSTKEIAKKPNGKMISGAHPGGSLSRANVNISSPIEGDDNTVVEKTVVILECEKPSIPVVHASEDKASVQIMQSDPYNPGGKSEDDIAIPHPASPIIVKEVDQESFEGHANAKSNTHWNERGPTYAEEESPNTTHVGATEEPYQAPYARISSVEEPCMSKSDYGKAPPRSSETGTAFVETTTVYVSDIQNAELVKISEVASAKHQGKEPSKGFRRLLKFGKKSSAASESNVESDKVSLDGSGAEKDASNGPSNEVFILKNLLTQEEGSSGGTTPKKSSRSFSLLSPFRSKTSEKKLTS